MIFRWNRDQLGTSEIELAKRLGKDPYEVLTEIAAKVSPGSDGLLFHPYLAGERAPLWNANARGSFFGLGLHHKKEHLIRAVLEGVIYNLYTVLLALKELIGEPKNSSDRWFCKIGTLETDDGRYFPSRRICSGKF